MSGGDLVSLRGPTQYAGLPVRWFGLDGTMILGCVPALIFPFEIWSWSMAGINLLLIFIATQMKIPSRQIPRRLLSMMRPSLMPISTAPEDRSRERPWPY